MVRRKTTKKKQSPKENGVCFNCSNAYLMQSRPFNPIVAECSITKERNVARMFLCNIGCFKRNLDESKINSMIQLC